MRIRHGQISWLILALILLVAPWSGSRDGISGVVLAQDSGPSMMEVFFALQEAFDRDPDARVSAKSLGVPAESLARIDTDGDAEISFEEFDKAMLRGARASLPSDRSDFTHLEDGGFPLNLNPEIVSASEATDIQDDDMVMGVVLNGEARAYPVNYMNGPYNEVVNDELGGEKIAPSW